MKKCILIVFLTAAVLSCGFHVFADSWALPKPQKYYSENKRYYIEIIPRELESQLKYFEDKVAKKEPAGSKPGVKDNYCKGIFYKKNDAEKYDRVWEIRLSNDVAPVGALVSDGGEYFVTFDNWHSVGHGNDVVVIYGQEGKIVKKLALSDIVPPNAALPHSSSSVWWGGKHYIDEKNLHLVLKVLSSWSYEPDEKPGYKDVTIDLRTGEPVKANEVAD
jgi:hypothetical protein